MSDWFVLSIQAGAKTVANGVVSAFFVLIALQWLTGIFEFLPESVLGAIVILALAGSFSYLLLPRQKSSAGCCAILRSTT
jgi:MFS superfamily sulfate permease-like transporter